MSAIRSDPASSSSRFPITITGSMPLYSAIETSLSSVGNTGAGFAAAAAMKI